MDYRRLSDLELWHYGVKGMKWGIRRNRGRKTRSAKTQGRSVRVKRLKRNVKAGKEFVKKNAKPIALAALSAGAMSMGMGYVTPIITAVGNVKIPDITPDNRKQKEEEVKK